MRLGVPLVALAALGVEAAMYSESGRRHYVSVSSGIGSCNYWWKAKSHRDVARRDVEEKDRGQEAAIQNSRDRLTASKQQTDDLNRTKGTVESRMPVGTQPAAEQQDVEEEDPAPQVVAQQDMSLNIKPVDSGEYKDPAPVLRSCEQQWEDYIKNQNDTNKERDLHTFWHQANRRDDWCTKTPACEKSTVCLIRCMRHSGQQQDKIRGDFDRKLYHCLMGAQTVSTSGTEFSSKLVQAVRTTLKNRDDMTNKDDFWNVVEQNGEIDALESHKFPVDLWLNVAKVADTNGDKIMKNIAWKISENLKDQNDLNWVWKLFMDDTSPKQELEQKLEELEQKLPGYKNMKVIQSLKSKFEENRLNTERAFKEIATEFPHRKVEDYAPVPLHIAKIPTDAKKYKTIYITDSGGCGRVGQILAMVALHTLFENRTMWSGDSNNLGYTSKSMKCTAVQEKDGEETFSSEDCYPIVYRVIDIIREANYEYVETDKQIQTINDYVDELARKAANEDGH